MKTLSELQLKVMNVLWELEEATVSDVVEALRMEKKPARTTISTVLSRLEKQGFVGHRTLEVSYLYYPLVKQDDVQQSMATRMVDALFGGDVTELVSQLLSASEYDEADLQRVIEMIKIHQEQHGDHD